MDWDDEKPKPKKAVVVGEALYEFSIEDLDERIAALEAEIDRVRQELDTKQSRNDAAKDLFKS